MMEEIYKIDRKIVYYGYTFIFILFVLYLFLHKLDEDLIFTRLLIVLFINISITTIYRPFKYMSFSYKLYYYVLYWIIIITIFIKEDRVYYYLSESIMYFVVLTTIVIVGNGRQVEKN